VRRCAGRRKLGRGGVWLGRRRCRMRRVVHCQRVGGLGAAFQSDYGERREILPDRALAGHATAVALSRRRSNRPAVRGCKGRADYAERGTSASGFGNVRKASMLGAWCW
jgi:hypothetical protein